MSPAPLRIEAGRLTSFTRRALVEAGMGGDHASAVAEILVEGDLLGHSTHGVALLPRYLKELRDGRMTPEGEPEVLTDTGNSASWDGRYLPGPSLVSKAFAQCCERAHTSGISSVAIGRSHHIACLAAYLRRVTDNGMIGILATSSPATRSVAPFGSVEGVYSPNPIAAGWPTDGDPVLVDVSMSITTNSLVGELVEAGRKLPHPWLLDSDGNPSDDPTLLDADPPGALLPIGGFDHGHKGFALGLLVEALTSGLAGHGRADAPGRWGASVFVLVINPAGHGGEAKLRHQAAFLAQACRSSSVAGDNPAVRLPGERALRLRREQLKSGIALAPDIARKLQACSPIFSAAFSPGGSPEQPPA